MLSTESIQLRMRPAHPSGPTFLTYTPNGRRLITVGINNTVRVFESGSNNEPLNIDDCQESNLAVVCSNEFFITGSEDGSVCKYSLHSLSLDTILTRCTLPVRDLALSADGLWVAVASEEISVKIVNVNDMTRLFFVRDHDKPAKHVSFDHQGKQLCVSCIDGSIYMYDITKDEPSLVAKLDGVIKALEPEAQANAKVVWHPDDQAFAAATPTRDIQTFSRKDGKPQKSFRHGHTGDITALAWSPNGAFLATAALDRVICLWDTRTQRIIRRFEHARAPIWAFAWHPLENILSYANDDGELHIHTDFVPTEHADSLSKSLLSAPLSEISGNASGHSIVEEQTKQLPSNHRGKSTTSLDEILGEEPDSVVDDYQFIEDDDGNGYAEVTNERGKRPHSVDGPENIQKRSRTADLTWELRAHPAFQPGSTPWRGDRRYLCLNLVGCAWIVKQATHNTITVEFYDRELHRDFHFTDLFDYDKACLNSKGLLLSSKSTDGRLATIYYRPHETWTTRSEWRANLKRGEDITAVALSDSFIIVATSKRYIRIFTLFGVPIRSYRHKNGPIVACATWRDYVLTITNGHIGVSGVSQLLYTLENIKRNEIYQSEDALAIDIGSRLTNVFFAESGDPCIYGSDGVLLMLEHWRSPGQARWVPVLDTSELERLADGRKEETYWPVGVALTKLYCIILKGGDCYPYFPRPLLSEFDFNMPSGIDDSKDINDPPTLTERAKLEAALLRESLLHSLLDDSVSATNATQAQRAELGQKSLEIDKILLQLLAMECVEGEERGMKAMEIVALLRDHSGRMLDAAAKIAIRFGRSLLGEKIQELAERQLVGGLELHES